MSTYAKDNPADTACIEELIAVLQRHGMSLGHEDGHGAFVLEPRGDTLGHDDWLRAAFWDEGADAVAAATKVEGGR